MWQKKIEGSGNVSFAWIISQKAREESSIETIT
jgi:hypothetical protein